MREEWRRIGIRPSGACAGVVVAWIALAGPSAVLAQDDYAVEPERSISLRALLDLRIVRAGPAPSWKDRGPGKTRYGGVDDDGHFERVTRFAIAQLALEPEARLPWGIAAHAQVNWDGDVDDRGDVGPTTTRRAWSRAGCARSGATRRTVGRCSPACPTRPFSLEHTGPAWTPRYTLTPSALNTWLWEEGRVLGLRR